MALSTYAELKASVADWLDRSDLTSQIVDFIALAEAAINVEMNLRTVEADSSLSSTAGSRTIALPAGYREPVALWFVIDGERVLKEYRPAPLLDASAVQGEPEFWCIDGTAIAFERPCDQAYSVVFRHRGGLALSGDAPTNLVLTNYPNLYLFGALKEAGVFLRDNDLISLAETKFQAALTQAKWKEGRASALTTLRTEVAMAAPARVGFDINQG